MLEAFPTPEEQALAAALQAERECDERKRAGDVEQARLTSVADTLRSAIARKRAEIVGWCGRKVVSLSLYRVHHTALAQLFKKLEQAELQLKAQDQVCKQTDEALKAACVSKQQLEIEARRGVVIPFRRRDDGP